ncbi:EVE domain-containing protein [Patescibacteria group bacterium]|nr:EVE domain-containing protein [Patescibacteria group bacterium]
MEKTRDKKYWLMKSEPSDYSIDDLKRAKCEPWDGVRNYQARNFMRDEMRVGDGVLFYHSSTDPPGIAGIAKVCSKPYPDKTAFDKSDKHFDPKSKKDDPTWYLVDVCFVKKFKNFISLNELKADPRFEGMMVTKKGSRLSIQPVSKKHFDGI